MRFDRREQQRKTHSRRLYYYARAIYQGRLILTGPYGSETEGRQDAYSNNLPPNFEIVAYDTIDAKEATKRSKKWYLDQSKSLDLAMQRAKHQIAKEIRQ